MAEPKKNTIKNTLKDSKEEVKSSENKSKKEKIKEQSNSPKSPFRQRISNLFAFVYDERFQKIFGLTLILFAVYLSIAFASFVFTWQNDYSAVVGNLFSPEIKVENWLGKAGALLSHIFIYKWFGFASYIFPVVFFAIGAKILFNAEKINLNKIYANSFFWMIFLSIGSGYIFRDSQVFPGGAFGYVLSNKLNDFIGTVGTGVLLGFTFIVFLVVAFNIAFKSNKENPEVEDEAIEPVLKEEAKLEIKNTVKEKLEDTKSNVFEITNDTKHDIVEDIEKPIDNEPLVLSSDTDAVPFTVENAGIIENKAEELTPEQIAEALKAQVGEYDPTLDLSSYQFPPIDLLEDYGGSKDIVINTEELTANKDRILKTLGDYGIEITKILATVGPTVTLYEIIPAAGVRISKIKNLEDDIALSLSALGIRIIAPMPGKGTIGIEVPNLNPEMVPMRTLLASEKFQNTKMDLPIALGKTISNEIFIADLAKMPHLLMAGATGQGKSVGLNAVLVSLLYKKHPSQIKFVLVDPKKVELTLFNKIERHYLAKLPDSADAIITDTKKVVHTLNSLCIEMDQRYDLLKDAEVRNLREYNAKFISRKLNPNNGHKFLPYIVLVVDEFADLIMTAGKEVETPIARLAQLARAIGIHLIIATQRPSVNIITGTIKANFPARIAFRVTSKIDSRTILDSGGADQLIGRGDMLLSTGNDLIRLQCAFVDTPEVDKICDFIGSQRSYPTAFMLPEYVDENGEGSGSKDDDPSQRDAFFKQAAEIVVQTQQGSASLLQRRLKLGYNRAGRIVDQLESAGIIGPFEGSKAREVLIKDMLSLDQFLKESDNK